MKTLLLGDLHLNVKNLQRSSELLNHLKAIIDRTKPDLVIQLGDVFHNHNILHLESLQLYTNFLKSIKTQFVQIVGNHDMINSVTLFPENHAYVAFNFPNVLIVDKPMVYNDMLLLPFIPPGQFWDIVNKISTSYQMIVCHQEFKGAEFLKGIVSENGDEPPQVPTISGHVHGESVIGKCWYTGTPIQHDFGDTEHKAVYLIDLQPPKWKVLEIIEVALPKYKTVHLQLGSNFEPPMEPNGLDFMRYEIVGDKADIFAFKQSQEYKAFEKLGKIKFSVRSTDEQILKTEYKSFNQLLKEYCINDKLEHVYDEIIINKF